MKCGVVSSTKRFGNCNKKGRFKIVDYECSQDCDIGLYDYYSKPFWVCDDCIKHFIDKNEDEPHYILLEVRD